MAVRGYRGGWLVGVAAGAVLVLSPLATAPQAHADIDDLIFQPILDAITQATSLIDPSLAASATDPLSLDALFADLSQALGYDPVDNVANAAAAVGAAANTVPLTMNAVTEPVASLSVSGGPDIPVLVDTGSNGLVVPWYDLGFQNLGFPTNFGIGAYSGGLDYFYVTLPATVDFGNGIVTAQTPVDAELFAWPTTFGAPGSFESFFNPAGADGVLGIGPNAIGPGPSSVITALPGDLGQGVLINESAGQLVFGSNPITDGVSLSGSPLNQALVSINGGAMHPVTADFDSGGVYGAIPSSLVGNDPVGQPVPAGTEISVYAPDKTPLYSYMTTATDSPTVVTGNTFNTGYQPFFQYPVYVGNSPAGVGTTTLDV